ncbi:MAG: hypothetical protein D6734_01095 [Candidatus Schekmanbacteria bacterium]|nr:MAG: hypothetical protein D6734_01095 [Candidatus Schekmanbacteria bacterium]
MINVNFLIYRIMKRIKKIECPAFIFLVFLIVLSFLSSASADSNKIKGTVFNDKNCNGIKNPGESGIAGVLITLNPTGQTDITNHKGKYEFKKLKEGIYTVIETDPEGYCSTTSNIFVVEIKKKHKDKKKSSKKDDDDADDDEKEKRNYDFGDTRKSISPPAGCCIY